jgi:hypothetical protein
MQHNVVSSEITGRGYRFPNVPAQTMKLCLACEIRNIMSRQEACYAASCGAIGMMRKQESAEAIVAQRRE